MAIEETGISRQRFLEVILAQENPDLTNVVVVFDVDQVLAEIMVDQVRTYNELLNLDIPEEEMRISVYHRQTFEVPQIANRRKQDKDTQQTDKILFEQARGIILESEDIHLNFPPMAGAVSGVSLLSSLFEKYHGAFGGYFTARRPKAGAVTPQWLDKNGFRKGKVVVCTDSKDKLKKIIQQFSLEEESTNTRVFLLDDSIQSLAQAAKTLLNETDDDELKKITQRALSRITVGAFSYTQEELSEMQEVNGAKFSVVPFPWWTTENISSIIKTLSSLR